MLNVWCTYLHLGIDLEKTVGDISYIEYIERLGISISNWKPGKYKVTLSGVVGDLPPGDKKVTA